MGLNASLCLFSLTFLLKYSNFSTMNDLLIKTKLNIPISKYLTITLLALKNILMNHVILDYYDEMKFNGMKEKSIMLTTLYQTTGLGEEMNGFLNCTKSKGRVYFGSGVKGSPLVAEYVKALYHNPYNMSIVQISMPIVAPGLTPGPGPADEDNASDTDVPKHTPTTETAEVDSPAPTPSADNEKVEAADKAGTSSSACKASLRFDVVLLLLLFGSFAGL
ncbi:hypothetical protein Bca52824_038563 [Brassica carinata]|uniref:Uncharacterized protein n=1 Tax=Brassica carinata TaxID=52824 RepID=A0A8X7RUC8_BRACI|nr:hypothetical protein Bca52824_038563 [Brassica carinata]